MNVLLLNPPGPFCRAGSRWPHSRRHGSVGIDYHPFPFYLAYAASRLMQDGHRVLFIDCIATGTDDEALKTAAGQFRPDVCVMETSAPSFSSDSATALALAVPCVAVGAHATATPAEHINAGFVAVIVGEYDQVISQALASLWCGRPACTSPQPPWLWLRDAPATQHAPMVSNLDEIPPPPWRLMPMEKYNDPICRGRSVTVLSSRGCSHRCEFCTLAPYHGAPNYRMRDPRAVCDEIGQLIGLYHPDEVYFDDDSITLSRKHILGLCDEYRARGFGLPFCCMGHATVGRDVLEAMARAGCRAYKFGVESADPEVLHRIPKNISLDDVIRTVRDCNDLGILTHATYLLGLPGETRDSARHTIDFALKLGTHTLQFAIATPYPGTALYDRAKREGWLTKESWLDFDPAGEAVLSYPRYSASDIVEMHELAWRRWQRHMLLHKPATLVHHFRNAYNREGIGGALRLAAYGVRRLASAIGSRP